MSSFPEYIGSRLVPWREAEEVLSSSDSSNCLSSANKAVIKFLVASASEILQEPIVQADLDKRLRAGSGIPRHACSGSCSHERGGEPVSLLDQLIKENVTPLGLEEIVVNALKCATRTRSNVIEKGKQDLPMDATTDAFIRRKIWTESLVREIVINVKTRYSQLQSNAAKDGFLFAIPSTGGDRSEQITPIQMGELMETGITVISKFFTCPPQSLYNELERLDALGVFDSHASDASRTDLVYWSTLSGLSNDLKRLCEQISQLPFELNMKNKALLLQVCQYFQINLFKPNIGRQNMHADKARFTVVFPVGFKKGSSILKLKSGLTPNVSPGDLIIIDASKWEYMCPASDKDRFHVSAFLTGPPIS
jgi:hypothetical protein